MEIINSLYAGLLATFDATNVDFLKSIGIETAKEFAVETLKKLGSKVRSLFKNKPEEDTIDALENAINKKDNEKIKNKSESVLKLLKEAMDNDENFKNEVETIINELDDTTKENIKEIGELSVKNSKNVLIGNTFGNISGGFRVGDDIKK